jgi:hypothetical protein
MSGATNSRSFVVFGRHKEAKRKGGEKNRAIFRIFSFTGKISDGRIIPICAFSSHTIHLGNLGGFVVANRAHLGWQNWWSNHGAGRKRPLTRWILLQLEELETRALLSASGLTAINWTAHPELTVLPQTGPAISGLKPQQVQQAYGFSSLPSSTNGAGETIAIVDAFNDPNITSDANTFSNQFQLPQFNTTGGPTLSVVTPSGAKVSTLSTDKNWAEETSLDVEWAHAIAPEANILLVEAPSASLSDLLTAVSYAAKQKGVVSVSMSWGGFEFSGETASDSTFTTPTGHTPVTFVASAGDSTALFGPLWPATSPNVLAVGGTVLNTTTSNGTTTYKSESGWTDGGGGYSVIETAPTYQSNVSLATQYNARTTPDVAYDASPSTGVAIYDSFGRSATQSKWLEVGGTSVGSPQWAALVALADQQRGSALDTHQVEATLYNTLGTTTYGKVFHDETSGNNGYAAGTGYDLVTGLGSPIANQLVPLLAKTTIASGGSNLGRGTNRLGSFSSSRLFGFGLVSSGSPGGGSFTTGHSITLTTSTGASGNVASVPATMNVTSVTPLTNVSNGTTSINNNVFLASHLGAELLPTTLANAGDSVFTSANVSAASSSTVFGASGLGSSLQLSSFGMYGPMVEQTTDDLVEELLAPPQEQKDSDAGEGLEMAAAPIAVEGEAAGE